MTFNCWKFKGGKSKGCSVCAIALLSFIAGSLITARLAHIDHVRADSNRVFELRIYHTVTGQIAGTGIAVSRHLFQAVSQTRSSGHGLLGT
jgi:ABC-type Fe3+-siderophore transport system permease subunit